MPHSFEGKCSHCNFLVEENVPNQLSLIVWLDVNNGGPGSCWWWWNIWGPAPLCCGNSDSERGDQWPLTASAHCVSFPHVSRTCTSLTQPCRQVWGLIHTLPRRSVSGLEDLARESSGQVSLCPSPTRFLSPNLKPHHVLHRCPHNHPRAESTLQIGQQLSVNCHFSWHECQEL